MATIIKNDTTPKIVSVSAPRPKRVRKLVSAPPPDSHPSPASPKPKRKEEKLTLGRLVPALLLVDPHQLEQEVGHPGHEHGQPGVHARADLLPDRDRREDEDDERDGHGDDRDDLLGRGRAVDEDEELEREPAEEEGVELERADEDPEGVGPARASC